MKKNIKYLLVNLLCVILVGCAGKADETVDENNTVVTDVATSEEVSSEEGMAEAESGIPDGIDLNSTLDGEQWLDSFRGNVKQPVVVVFNDRTGKKEVVLDNTEVKMEIDDMLAIYHPTSANKLVTKYIDWSHMKSGGTYRIYTLETETENLFVRVYEKGKTGWETNFGIIIKEDRPVLLPTDEKIIPDGIDTNSSLPGAQWMQTFVENNIDEPIVVVFDDETGRKEVLQPYDDVYIDSENIRLGLYIPEKYVYPIMQSFIVHDTVENRCLICAIDCEELQEYMEMPSQGELILMFNELTADGNIDPERFVTIPITLILDEDFTK